MLFCEGSPFYANHEEERNEVDDSVDQKENEPEILKFADNHDEGLDEYLDQKRP